MGRDLSLLRNLNSLKIPILLGDVRVVSLVCSLVLVDTLRLKMTRSTTMLTVAGVAVGSLVAYAVYFDYKRRTDSTFRRQLRTLVFIPVPAQG